LEHPEGTRRRFEAIIFDLGSTLLHFEGDEATYHRANEALCRHLIECGLPLEGERFLADFWQRMQEYRQDRDNEFIEYTTAYILRTLLSEYGIQDLPDGLIQPALKSFYSISQAQWRVETDTAPVLETLRREGYRLGLISNASDDADVQALIDQSGIRGFFEQIITSAALGIRKPNPRIFHYVLDKMGIEPERSVMVGDTLGADILGAQNAGMSSIWVTRRASKAANSAHLETIRPWAVVENLKELPLLLASLSSS
jgi:2-haloalkanoic acid dehalogenase type II